MKLLIPYWQVVGGNIFGYTYFLQAGYFWSYLKFSLVILIVFTCCVCVYMILNYVFLPWHKRCWLFFLVNSILGNFPYMSIVLLSFTLNFFFCGNIVLYIGCQYLLHPLGHPCCHIFLVLFFFSFLFFPYYSSRVY